MDNKRRFCDHCDDYVTQRTYRLHHSLYCDKTSGKWQKVRHYSSEDDSNTDDERVHADALDSPDSSPSQIEITGSSDSQESVKGALVNELEDEDARLAGHLPEVDEEWMYMEQPPFNTVNPELWNLNEDDINQDFTSTANSQNHMYRDIRDDNLMCIIQWIMIFLCIWSSYCYVSDHAMEILISFIGAVFKVLGSLFPALAGMALFFPSSLNALKQKMGMNKDDFIKYVVCPKCETLYNFDDCYEERLGQTVIKKCQFVNNINHRQEFRRTACNEPLLKEVILQNGKKRLYPIKVFCYNSIIESLKRILTRKNFLSSCEQWRKRNVPQGFLTDIFDGKVWKDFLYIQEQPFLAAPNNFAFMMNVDWFQPFKHSLYSVGAIYMVFMNLPRDLRFKPENIILVGVIPGPHEPKLTINTYLKPLVVELQTLWKGIEVQLSEVDRKTIRAALLCVGCDVPAARKVCGFTGHGSCQGCSKCKKVFTGNVSERMDFSGFDPCPPRTNQEHRRQAQDILNQTSATDKSSKEKEYGTRFTELMMLPYFDCVRFHIIDPMHNLFTGTAKHIMKNVWLDISSPLIDKKKLEQIQKKIDKVSVPSTVGRLPKKICNSYGGFTADQWKAWTIIYSIYALWDVLPQSDLEVWRHFVLACSILCTPIITETKAQLGNIHLVSFCKGFENLYGM